MDINKNFGALIEQARKSKEWSQARLADELKISQVSVHRIERGEQPVSLARAIQISELLGIPIERIKQTAASDRLDASIDSQPEPIQSYIRKLIEENPS